MTKMPVFLIRGIPGSGKSTFAKNLKSALDSENAWQLARVFETDNFFVDPNTGEYKFESRLLGAAHNWNQAEVYRFCRDFDNAPCIVANSFTTLDELKPYREIAAEFGRPVCTITIKTVHQNVHGVPDYALQRMKDRWVDCRGSYEVHSDTAVPWIIANIVHHLHRSCR